MDLDHLRVFQHVAQTRSFSRAAEQMRIDRTRVSRIISALERELDVRLFVRTTRSVSTTPEGEALARRIAAPLGELERVVAKSAPSTAVPSGEVTVTATVDVGRALLAPRLPRFRVRYPAVRVRLVLSDEVIGFTRGIDLALRLGRTGGQNLVARKLRRVDTAFYAAPAYLDRRGTPVQLSDLGHHDGMWPVVREQRSFTPGRRPPPPAIECTDFGTLAELARSGGGVALLPTFVAAPYLGRGELVRVAGDATAGTAMLYLVSLAPTQLAPRVVALREFLLAELSER